MPLAVNLLRTLALLLLVLTGACTTTLPGRQAPAEDHTYLLSWQPGQASPTPDSGPSLQLGSVRSAAGYASSDILYVRHDHQIERYAHHRWVDSPARMLEPLLLRAAEHSGVFSAVAEPSAPISADFRLDINLVRLQQRILPEQQVIELSLRYTLLDTRGNRQVGSQQFDFTEPAGTTPYEGVVATNRAVNSAVEQLMRFLRVYAQR